MSRIPTAATTLAVLFLLTACAGSDQRETKGDRSTTPDMAAANPMQHRGKTVEWGGLLVASRNLQDHTEFEILALPLQNSGRPDREGRPGGRFVAVHPGYLETADYQPGQLVTITGPIIGYQNGRVGEKTFRYPEVLIDYSRRWRTTPYPNRPDVRFGIGVGSWGSGVSVGIGF